jgi:general secretion pathway protein D
VVYTFPPEGLSLEEAIQIAASSTGRAFKFTDADLKPKPKIMVAGRISVPKTSLYEFWQAIFVTAGFAMVPMGPSGNEFIQVENIASSQLIKQRANFLPLEDIKKYQTKAGEVVMTTIPLKYVKVESARNAVQQLMANRQSEFVMEVPSANAFIIVGFAPTVYAVYQIMLAMDVPSASAALRFDIVPLKNAVAEEMVTMLSDLISATTQGATPGQPRPARNPAEGIPAGTDIPEPKIIADPRTNAIVIYAVDSDLAEIKRLIAALDTPITSLDSNIRVYFLKNTNADDMEDVLKDLLSQQTSRSGRASGTRGSGGGQPTSASEIGQEVTIVGDVNTNSLLVTCTKTRYEEIEPIIQMLDRRRPQVMAHAAIAELSDNALREIGVELMAIQGGDDRYRFGALTGFGFSEITTTPTSGTGTGGTGTGGGGGGTTTPTLPTSFNFNDIARAPGTGFAGLLGGIIESDGTIPLLLSLLQTKERVNLLSNASVLTNDNEMSSISVGRSVATSQNSFDPSGQSRVGFQGYEDAVLRLELTPHISTDSYLRMELLLSVQAFAGQTATNSTGLPPDKTLREFKGSVTVPNGQTVVIGGLVQDNYSEVERSVPWLSEIPILGELFKQDSRETMKTTLYLFVTPTIISDFKTLEDVSYERKLEILRLHGNVKLVDPNFKPVGFESSDASLEEVEQSGNLDMPGYVPTAPVESPTTPAAPGAPANQPLVPAGR